MRRTIARLLFLSLLYASQTPGAEPQLGPVVKDYGPVFDVPAGSFNLDPDQQHCGYAASDLLPQVGMAVSAMSVHVRLQQEGYRAILF